MVIEINKDDKPTLPLCLFSEQSGGDKFQENHGINTKALLFVVCYFKNAGVSVNKK